MQLTDNFSLIEFLEAKFYDDDSQLRVFKEALSDQSVFNNLKELATNLQVLRDFLGKPIDINIAYRPKFWELKQGRSGNSKHCLGMAADIVVDGMHPHKVNEAIERLIADGKMKQGGVGKYNSFSHYDCRGHKARW